MGSVKSAARAPSAGRDTLAASIELGYRLTPQLGIGLEYGGLIPVDGCATWNCSAGAADFAPRFTRFMAFGEFRPGHGGLRLRAGVGVSRFCYSSRWSDNGWSFGDTVELLLSVFVDDYTDSDDFTGNGGYRCDARMNALGGVVSLGYDWPVAADAPVAVGIRLSAEAANFGSTHSIALPAFRHRAVTLSLHLNIN